MHQPEIHAAQRVEIAAQRAGSRVGEEEGQHIDTDHRAVYAVGRHTGKQGQADRDEVGESDVIEDLEQNRPPQRRLVMTDRGHGGGRQGQWRQGANDRSEGDLGHFVWFFPEGRPPLPEDDRC